MEILNKKWK